MAYIPRAYDFIPPEEAEQRERSTALIKSVLAQREEHDAELYKTALHESAHAVMGMLRGHKLKSLSIDLATGCGECFTDGCDSGLGHALVSAAGLAADSIIDGADYRLAERTTSRATMRKTLGYIVPDDVANIRRHLQRAGERDDTDAIRMVCDQARTLLRRADVWPQVERLADHLVKSGGVIRARGFRPARGTLARRLQIARRNSNGHRAKPKHSAGFAKLMAAANAMWASGVEYP